MRDLVHEVAREEQARRPVKREPSRWRLPVLIVVLALLAVTFVFELVGGRESGVSPSSIDRDRAAEFAIQVALNDVQQVVDTTGRLPTEIQYPFSAAVRLVYWTDGSRYTITAQGAQGLISVEGVLPPSSSGFRR